MRYALLHKTNDRLEAGQAPDPDVLARADAVLEEMRQAGVLLTAEGLMPSARGARVTFPDGSPRVVDGPFTETKELVAGLSIIRVESRDEAVGWALRFAEADPGTEIDILELAD
ncbi:YCII-related protein [Kribbella flavida DSM 17836]|uniref:YCII-related protein n=1 Tax=Kribbella flavida (strain DSM 17836 / JCM 10339 / NBRC 14399) TaxID=479435 RepID=D2PYI9_KRIFD|nr:YciI family protein [Kribbella flavida]ADB29835.1 YCII-related protein [Kribbella flavida DSM 17836]